MSLVNNTIPLTTITTPSPVPTTGANVSPVNNTIPSARARIIPESVIQPAMRSISFYYRIPDGKGNVSVIARLLNLRDNAIVNTSVLHLQASVHSNLTLTPVCIQLLSNLEESFRSRIQLDITVPTGSLFEMRSIETSQTDICKSEYLVVVGSLALPQPYSIPSKKWPMSGDFQLNNEPLWTPLSTRRILSWQNEMLQHVVWSRLPQPNQRKYKLGN